MTLLVAFVMLAGAAPDPGSDSAPVPDEIRSPVYPPAARAEGLGAEVEVRVLVDPDGRVVEATVVAPTGSDFDEAALAAARESTFRPALREGEPVAGAYTLLFVFEPPVNVGVEVVRGRVRELGSVRSLADTTVELGVEGVFRRTRTSRDGRFEFVDLPAGPVTLRASRPGYDPDTQQVEIEAGRPLDVELSLRPHAYGDSVAVATYADAGAPVEHRLDPDLVRRIPGSLGDPVRVVEALPGVAVNPAYDGQPAVRGAEGTHTRITVDGMDVPFVFHWFLGRSVIDPSLLDGVVFVPGGLPARRGQSAQAWLDARLADKRDVTPGLHGRGSLDVLDASLALWGRKGPWTLSGAGRGAWIGAIVSAASATTGSTFAPNYWDYSASAQHRRGADVLAVTVLGAGDSLRSNSNLPDASVDLSSLSYDPRVSFLRSFHRAKLAWRHDGARAEHATFVAGGWQDEQNPEGRQIVSQLESVRYGRLSGWTVQGSHETSVQLGPSTRLDLGAHGDLAWYATEAYPTPTDVVTGRLSVFWASPFVELGQRAGPVRLALGGRASAFGLPSGIHTIPEPRGSIAVDLTDEVELELYGGRYAQRPTPGRLAELTGGNPGLSPVQSWSGGAGLDARWPQAGVQVQLNAYASWLDSVVVRQTSYEVRLPSAGSSVAELQALPAFVDATGRGVGGDVLVRFDPRDRWFGWGSVSVGRTWRTSGRDTFRSDRDQPVGFTLAGGTDLGRQWRLTGRLRVASGRPYTPPVPVYDVQLDAWTALPGPINAARLPVFRQLDVRLDKSWVRPRARYTIYLDVFNATWARNPLFAEFTPDYRQRVTHTALPMIPDLGLEVTF